MFNSAERDALDHTNRRIRVSHDSDPRMTSSGSLAKPAAKSALMERVVPSVGQYLYHLSHDLKSFTRAETLNAVIGAKPAEIQRVAKLAAKLKGRYLAMVVDLGATERSPIGEAEMRALERARFMADEAQAGLEALRAAIESGDLELDGVRAAE
jgi:hypothetical protein